jgi:hypothetical protein
VLTRTPLQRFHRGHLLQRHHRLGFGDRIMDGEVGTQAVAVVHQHRPAKTQPGVFPRDLPIQHAVRIGPAPVRGVATLLPTEVGRRIAGILRLGDLHLGRIAAILAPKAPQAGPGFDRHAVGTELFVDGPALLARQRIDLDAEQPGHSAERTPS